jgi:thiol:disulfide interchange protein
MIHPVINMRKRIFGSIAVLMLIIAAGALVGANGQSISGSIGNGTATRGKTVRATVVLNIPSGLHVNSNSPNSEYAIPTTVKVTSGNARIGGVSYPRGRNRKFSFSEHTINVYEGSATFRFNVTVPARFRGNRISVRVVVRYQACTDEVCYPPRSKEMTLTANVN